MSCNQKKKIEQEQAVDVSDFVQVQGDSLVLGEQNWIPKGVNIGNWLLLEDFMLGLEGTHSQLKKATVKAWGDEKATFFWKKYEEEYVTEQDIKFLKEKGMNCIRAPFNMNFFSDTKTPRVAGDHFWARLDHLVALCKKHDMKILWDMHAVPGGQSLANYGDAVTGTALFWEHEEFMQKATDFWVQITERYSDDPTVFGFGLLNEPYTDKRPELLTNWYKKTSEAIRAVDAHHVIVLGGDVYSKGTVALTPELFEDPQTMIEWHFYCNMISKGQRLTEWPAIVNGDTINFNSVKKHFEPIMNFEIKRPKILGEFGIKWNSEWTENSMLILNDVFNYLEEDNIGWCLWTYKDAGSMGWLKPKEETEWSKFVNDDELRTFYKFQKEIVKKNWENSEEAGELHQAFLKLRPKASDRDINLATNAASRIFEGLVAQEFFEMIEDPTEAELEALAKSFHFDNCGKKNRQQG